MLRLNIKRISIAPGIYFFRDKHGRILYIGKAVNLKNRLANYFKPQLGGRTAKLMEETARVNWQETDSEIEALILESQLIKKYRPPFNIMLRDDKQYFYVGFNNDKFPKIFITHQPLTQSPTTNYQSLTKKRMSSSLEIRNYQLEIAYAGPFTDGSALKTTLRLLRRIFPYCTCKQKHNNFCLNYHIGKCGGICCLKQLEPNFQFLIFNFQKGYNKNIKAIKEILSGKRVSLIKKLKKEMVDLGNKHEFEKAIELRGKIEKLEKVFENAQILQNTKYKILNTESAQKPINLLTTLQNILKLSRFPHRIEGYDISNIQGKFATGAMAVFINGQPDKNKYRKFKIKLGNESNDIAMLKEVLTRRFNHPEWPNPDLVIMDGGKAQFNVIAKIISDYIFSYRKTRGLAITSNSIPVVALTKNARHQGDHIFTGSKKASISLKDLPPTVKNLILQINSEAHRFAISYYRKLHRKF